MCAKSPLPSFPLWLFPCPCSILLPCPRRGRVHFTPFFLFFSTLRLLSSHIRHNSLLSLNMFLYFHFTLQMMLELKNLLSFELIKCSFFAYLFTISVPYHYSYADYQQNCSDLQRAGWQLGLIMMIILSKYDHDSEDRLAWL